ncbi:hypothetical protein [Spirosoma areae]
MTRKTKSLSYQKVRLSTYLSANSTVNNGKINQNLTTDLCTSTMLGKPW